MKACLIVLILYVLANCTTNKKHAEFYLSPGLENMKLFASNKSDSIKIDAFYTNAEKCLEKGGSYCDTCNKELWADFKNGIAQFRIELFKNIKLPKNAKQGENRVRVIIGTANSIEKIEVLKFTDINSKNAIEKAFEQHELNTWTSSKIYGIPVNQQFEISIFVK
ncbi:hypothetical protein [Chryseobacterium taihuense]|uniref:TonB protein C-terminal n=1 Tax=Chryseobacterium taihuense TaxID=1141221 RepID=A0ABY0R2V5_9FLAO|nr:hypothetical protein [Chryseobacterium taihuense]SDM33830.1 hypothetical protein SAMN05216273_1243 [Chryseobacterium taihuense]